MPSGRKRFLEGSVSNNTSSSNYLQNDIESEKYLTKNFIIILFGILLIVLLLLSLLIYALYRRFRSHSQILNGKCKSDDNVDEYICFTKSEKVPLARYTQIHTPETAVKSVNIPLQSLNKPNNKMAYWTADDSDDFYGELTECKPTYGYSVRHQTSYIKSDVIQSTQQFIESAELRRKNENFRKLTDDQEKSKSNLLVDRNCRGIRRASSTPNIPKLINNQSNNVDINLSFNPEEEDEENAGNNSRPFDDHKFFKVNDENDEDIADFTLIDSVEDSEANDTLESAENQINQLPFIPIRYPSWIKERGIPERGYITLAIQIEGDLSNSKKHPFLSVRIFDARCVLSRNVDPKAGKFYVKARLQLAGTNNYMSMLSLDQVSTKSLKISSDKMDIFTMKRNCSTMHSGRTPVKRAYRSPVFRYKIVIPLPLNIIDAIINQSTSLNESIESISSISLEDGAMQNYELKIDLKERNACKTNDLHGTATVQYLPYWRSSQLIGSVRIPITFKMWQYLLGNVNKLRRSTVVNLPISQVTNTNEKSSELLSNKLLWFVRCLQVPDENANSRGEITFGMQYNQENGNLIISLFNCAAMNLPKRTKNLFVRASLCSNWKLFRTVQSRPTARLSVNSAEFMLGEKLNFIIEEEISSVCVILSVFARSGSKLQEAITLIGRCVTGPPDLACGDGLSHWSSVCSKQGMIRRTHILS
ncbi:unnamed protein product [Schistosoma turkestanicum]|nr:unnamed protein product [Schistosoma turkestanicum]